MFNPPTITYPCLLSITYVFIAGVMEHTFELMSSFLEVFRKNLKIYWVHQSNFVIRTTQTQSVIIFLFETQYAEVHARRFFYFLESTANQ